VKPTLKPLDRQVMVITGASSGIGLATALAAASRRAQLVVAARSGNTLESLVGAIAASGGTAIHVVADVSERRQVARIADEAVHRFGGIDTWVNGAGASVYGGMEELPDAANRRLLDVNFWGVVHGSLVALPHLRASGGALINVGSDLSEPVVRLQGMYAASKHAVKGFTEALRKEVAAARLPVSVTLIQPAAVNTPFPDNARNYTDREPELPTTLLDPWQVAGAILHAAVLPRRDVNAASMAKRSVVAPKLAPGLADWMARQTERQHGEALPSRSGGALFTASEKGRVHGRPRDGAA
jgi:short-subunit dehydrogenase